MEDKERAEHQVYYMPLGMCWGTSLGVIVGIITDNLSVCLAIGTSIGLCVGLLIDAMNHKKAKDAPNDEEAE